MCGIGLMCVEGVCVEMAGCVGLVEGWVGCNNGYGCWIGLNNSAECLLKEVCTCGIGVCVDDGWVCYLGRWVGCANGYGYWCQ